MTVPLMGQLGLCDNRKLKQRSLQRFPAVLALVVKEPAFGGKAAGITGKAAVVANDAMAGNEQSQSVLPVCGSYRAHGLIVAAGAGQLQIAARFSVRYLHQ